MEFINVTVSEKKIRAVEIRRVDGKAIYLDVIFETGINGIMKWEKSEKDVGAIRWQESALPSTAVHSEVARICAFQDDFGLERRAA